MYTKFSQTSWIMETNRQIYRLNNQPVNKHRLPQSRWLSMSMQTQTQIIESRPKFHNWSDRKLFCWDVTPTVFALHAASCAGYYDREAARLSPHDNKSASKSVRESESELNSWFMMWSETH